MVRSPLKESRSGSDSLSVMSANLCHDWPRHRRLHQRLEAFAELVEREKADVLLLQEVARTAEVHAEKWLAERLGMAYVYARANGHRQIGFEEGLAVFSSFPLEDPQVLELNQGNDLLINRLALTVNIKAPGREFLATSVHLSLRKRRNIRQVMLLHQWIEASAQGRMALVGGDFNASENSQQIRKMQTVWLDTFRSTRPGQQGATHALDGVLGRLIGKRRLDYIFLQPGDQPWKVIDTQHLETQELKHSDHFAVLMRFAPI